MQPIKGWQNQANCKGEDSSIFFPEVVGDQQNGLIWAQAKAICSGCPVKLDCLKSELAHEEVSGRRNGMWGGMTPKERDQYVRLNKPLIVPMKKP